MNIINFSAFRFPRPKIGFPLGLFKSKNSDSQRPNGDFILFPDVSAGKEIEDSFTRKKVGAEIAKTIKRSPGQINFLISGEWGIGKTSILNLIEKDLGNIKCVWFSPWKYSNSTDGSTAISRAFITEFATFLNKRSVLPSLYQKKQIEDERNLFNQIITLISIILRYIIFVGVIFFLLFFSFNLLFQVFPVFKAKVLEFISDKPENQLALLGFISGVLALPPLGQYFISKVKEQSELEKINSPELFEQTFNDLINNSVRFKSFQIAINFLENTFHKTPLAFLGKPLIDKLIRSRIFSFFRYKKIVVFIDDLDRCEDKDVEEFLTGMKTFFEHKSVYYVIAADVEKLKNKISNQEPDFLRKIIQLDWNVPYINKNELEDYVKLLFKEANFALELITIKEVSQLLLVQPNPRKIKYYLRRLLFLLNLQSALNEEAPKFTKQQISYILKVIMIAEIDNDTYSFLSKNLSAIPVLEKGEGYPKAHNEIFEEAVKDPNVRRKINEKLERIKNLFKLPPQSKEINLQLAEVFRLVGSFEEEIPDTSKFLELAESNPEKAMKYLDTSFAWNWKRVLNGLSGNISQNIDVINAATTAVPPTSPSREIDILRHQVNTFIRSLKKYDIEKDEETMELVKGLLSLLPSLNTNFPVYFINGLDQQIFSLALQYQNADFFHQLLSQSHYQDITNYKQALSALPNEDLLVSKAAPVFLTKTLQFLKADFDNILELIKQKKLLEVENIENFHSDLIHQELINEYDPIHRRPIIELFSSTPNLPDGSKKMIVGDILGNEDLDEVLLALNDAQFSSLLFITENLAQLKEVMTSPTSIGNAKHEALIQKLFEPANFENLQIWKDEYGVKLAKLIVSAPTDAIKTSYIKYFINRDLKSIIKVNGAEDQYKKILEELKKTQRPVNKGKITRYSNSLS